MVVGNNVVTLTFVRTNAGAAGADRRSGQRKPSTRQGVPRRPPELDEEDKVMAADASLWRGSLQASG